MGQRYSAPQAGVTPLVIGAGLPRTGTSSFCRALEILLDRPVYHGGTQVTLGPPHEVKSWVKLLSQWPPTNQQKARENLQIIKSRIDGFVATADSPCCGLVPELLELYPNAIVICTVRDLKSWQKSMAQIAGAATKGFLRIVLFPLPTMRHFVDYIDVLKNQWGHLYGENDAPTRKSYNGHIEWLKQTVPADKLVFYDVKDGWEPLCRVLNVPVPEDIPFPHVNDSEAIERFSRACLKQGLRRWLAGLTCVLLPIILGLRFLASP
jgi:hypothetical protein